MDYEQIKVALEDGVGVLTLNRPERLNAWTYRMSAELADAIGRCNADPAIGAMVITGAGRGFCAGADIKDTFQSRESGGGGRGAHDPTDWVRLLRTSKPVIAAINGPAVGVGLTMILPCDVILASTAAKFAMAFVKMGVLPELGSSHFLVQRLGFGRASEMCLTGRMFGADEALDARLVDRLTAPDELLPAARELAATIGANPPPHLRWIKELLTVNGTESDLDVVQMREGRLLQRAYASPEHREAVSAFLEKRPPDFRKAREGGGT
jgi:2-(1,2-epoxy-1,2-dihydrophenyl)acetyl-CoA isomerase